MKRHIAALALLLAAAAAFAQKASVQNKVKTEPNVIIGDLKSFKNSQYGFKDGYALREQVSGEAVSADERAVIAGEASVDLAWKDNTNSSIASPTPRQSVSVSVGEAGAKLQATEWLEVTVTSGKLKQEFGPPIYWDNNGSAPQISIVGITGTGEARHDNHKAENGIYAAFTGVKGLWIGGGIAAGEFSNYTTGGIFSMYDGGSFIKKGAWGPFQAGVKYSSSLFDVGAKWHGQFGKFDGSDAATTDFHWNRHDFYAGFTFKGLQAARFPTTFGVGAEYYLAAASDLKPMWLSARSWAVSANIQTRFRRGVSDALAVTVGYKSIDGSETKVLPFYVGNTLALRVSDSALFELYTAYEQMGLERPFKDYTPANRTDVASQVVVNPTFSLARGGHLFSLGVEACLLNRLAYKEKTNADWGFFNVYGETATVSIPITWLYRF